MVVTRRVAPSTVLTAVCILGRPSYYQQNGVLVGPIDAPYSPGLHPRTTAN